MTLRELVWMAEARSRDHWNHTSAILALTANTHRDPKKSKTFKPTDFHPHTHHPPEQLSTVPVSVLKQVFVDRQAGK
ncbi:MAG: hypothetical protein ABGZ35_05305 [Planctomycetaceae bacterium]